MKKIISLLLTVCMVISLGSIAFADRPVFTDTDYWSGTLWELVSVEKDVGDVHKGSWTYLGKHTATRAGEYAGFEYSETYSHTYSGTISCSMKAVQASLGYSFGKSKTFSKTAYSASLDAGETVKAYWIPTYSKSKINQREISYILHKGEYEKYEPTGKTKTAYGYEAIMPDIKFEYYSSSSSLNTNSINSISIKTKPKKVEIYKANSNGEYYLYEVIGN